MKLLKTSGFAHLLGLAEAKAKADEDEDKKSKRAADDDGDDDDKKQREDESDEDYAKRMEDEDDKEGAGDADPEDEENDKKSKKSKRAEDDDAAAAERSRCAEIIAHGIANGSVRQAAVFAFDTGMSAQQAISALKASALDGKSRGPGLRERMQSVDLPTIGADADTPIADPNDPRVIAARVIAAGKKRRGES